MHSTTPNSRISSRVFGRALSALVCGVFLHVAGAEMSGAQVVTPEHLLTIGQVDGPDEYVFGTAITPLFAPDGRPLVLDRLPGIVRVYDDSGDFQLGFGGRGAGPGEFLSASHPFITADSQLVVFDSGQDRVTFFELDGEVDHTERVEPIADMQSLVGLMPLRHGFRLGVTAGTYSPNPEVHDPNRAWVLLQRDRVADTVASFRVPVVTARWMTDRGPYLAPVRIGPEMGGAVALSGDSLLAVADGRTGVVSYFAIEPEGPRSLRTVALGVTAKSVSADDRRELESAVKAREDPPPGADLELDVAAYWSVVSSAVFAADGHLWVRTHPEADGDGGAVWRIITPSGTLLNDQIAFPDGFRLTDVARDRLIGEYQDELGVRYARIYSWSPGARGPAPR